MGKQYQFSRQRFLPLYRNAPVHHDVLPGDERRLVATEKANDLGNFRRMTESAERNDATVQICERPVAQKEFFRFILENCSRRDAVYSNSAR